MTRIGVVEHAGWYLVSVRGTLRASDLRRLELACGKALELEVVPLAIHLDTVATDPVVNAYLERLRARGAKIDFAETVRAGVRPHGE